MFSRLQRIRSKVRTQWVVYALVATMWVVQIEFGWQWTVRLASALFALMFAALTGMFLWTVWAVRIRFPKAPYPLRPAAAGILVALGFALATAVCAAAALRFSEDHVGPHWLLPVLVVGAVCMLAGLGLIARDSKKYIALLKQDRT